ncbi:helix-turn-helix domain-containing protein [Microbacterium sp. K2]|uniref:helix-turn-helix domain-containing protein n=1 Tax=Microbacterium sp. K2 TaxID=3391827 RepID=UPI003EDB4EAD
MTTTDNNLITHEFRAAENLSDLLTVKELATYLQVSVHTIYYWRGQGDGPEAVLLGKHLRFPKRAVIEWSLGTAA